MLIILKPRINSETEQKIINRAKSYGIEEVDVSRGKRQTVIGLIGKLNGIRPEFFEGIEGVVMIKNDRVGLAGRLPPLVKIK